MTKPARPHPILGEALTRNRYTTWSGLTAGGVGHAHVQALRNLI